MNIDKIFKLMQEKDASDLFYRIGGVMRMRINGEVEIMGEDDVMPGDMQVCLDELIGKDLQKKLREERSIDFSVYKEGLGRFRVNVFFQRNTPSFVVRYIPEGIKGFEDLNLPAEPLKKLCAEVRGLVIVTGSTGSGKSTTLASMIEFINQNFKKHILTIEEPIEFTFEDKLSIINQRELGTDVFSYEDALRQFALQSPDIIYIGNIRDSATMNSALRAAETGVLVLSTMHTTNASQSIERILNFFPPFQHDELRTQISLLLKGVLCLRLVPTVDGKGRIPAYELMTLSPTIARLVRENKTTEIPKHILQSQIYGMQTFKQSLSLLTRANRISKETALKFADSPEDMKLELEGLE